MQWLNGERWRKASYVLAGTALIASTPTSPAVAALQWPTPAGDPANTRFSALADITPDNIGTVRAAGARRVAVSHAICAAADPQAVARRFRAALISPVNDAP